MITLVRRKEPRRNATGMLEESGPLIFPAKCYPEIQFAAKDKKKAEEMGGVETWAFSHNTAIKKQSGDNWEPSPKSIKFMGQSEGYSMESQMDLIYFLLYKCPRVYHPQAIAQGKVKKGDLVVEDRGLRASEKLKKERDELKLKNAIMAPDSSFPLHSDENLRKVAAAWGIEGSMDEHESASDLRFRLEHSVVEADKNRILTKSGRGYDEFFEMIDFDDSVRQRAMIMYAIDTGKVKYDRDKNVYTYVNGGVLLDVPDNKKYDPFNYLANHLYNKLNDKEWDLFKKEVIDNEYLEMLSFGDLKWLARQNEITLSKKGSVDLRSDLCGVYCG